MVFSIVCFTLDTIFLVVEVMDLLLTGLVGLLTRVLIYDCSLVADISKRENAWHYCFHVHDYKHYTSTHPQNMMGSLKISHTNVQLKLNSPALFITCASIMCALGSECHTFKIWTIACSVFYWLYHVIWMSFNYQTQFSPEFKCTFENWTFHNQIHPYHLNTRLAWYLDPTLCPFLWYCYHMEII